MLVVPLRGGDGVGRVTARAGPPPSVPALAVDLSRRRALVLRSTASPLRKPVRTRRGPATVTGERGPPCTTTARAREGPGDSRRRRPVLHRQSSRDRLGSRPYFAVKDPLIGLGPVRAVGERPHSAARTAPTTAASHRGGGRARVGVREVVSQWRVASVVRRRVLVRSHPRQNPDRQLDGVALDRTFTDSVSGEPGDGLRGGSHTGRSAQNSWQFGAAAARSCRRTNYLDDHNHTACAQPGRSSAKGRAGRWCGIYPVGTGWRWCT